MFTRMDHSTEEEWQHISEKHMPHIFDMPKRIISMLKEAESLTLGFGTDQLHHALQTATMARRAGAEDEMVLISLIHDIGKVINVPNHGQIAAEMIKPYVSEDAITSSEPIRISRASITITTWESLKIYASSMRVNHGMQKQLNLPMNGIKLHLILIM